MKFPNGMVSAVLVAAQFAAAAPTVAGTTLRDLTVSEARELLSARAKEASFIVLDVRTPGEFAGGHLPGAINIDALSKDFENRLGTLDRAKSYLVYCRSGNRSRRAIADMTRMGFSSLFHMPSGMQGWTEGARP